MTTQIMAEKETDYTATEMRGSIMSMTATQDSETFCQTCLGAQYIPPGIPAPPDKLKRSPSPPMGPTG